MTRKKTQTVGDTSWRNSSRVCAYSDADRHLGHIVRAGEGWIAFGATHATTHGRAFRPLGFFRSIATAMQAVQSATEPEPACEAGPVSFRGTVV